MISNIHVLLFFLGTEKSILDNGLRAKMMTIFRPVPLNLHPNREDNKDLEERGPTRWKAWIPEWLHGSQSLLPTPQLTPHANLHWTVSDWLLNKLLLLDATDILELFVIKATLPWPIQHPIFYRKYSYWVYQNPWVLELLDPWILDKLNSVRTFKIFTIERLITPLSY